MTDRHTTNESAFTFIEVLVALAIAAIGLLGLLRLHLISVASAEAAQATTEAVFLAQEKLAEASAARYPTQGTKSGTAEQNGHHFAWRIEITEANSPNLRDLTVRGLCQIRAFVTWQHGAGQKSVQMTTYVANRRIHE